MYTIALQARVPIAIGTSPIPRLPLLKSYPFPDRATHCALRNTTHAYSHAVPRETPPLCARAHSADTHTHTHTRAHSATCNHAHACSHILYLVKQHACVLAQVGAEQRVRSASQRKTTDTTINSTTHQCTMQRCVHAPAASHHTESDWVWDDQRRGTAAGDRGVCPHHV